MKHSLLTLFSALLIIGLSACSDLNDKEKGMVGSYFISEISDIEPLLELNDDGTSRMHAIQPGVISFSVGGTWSVSGDKLVIKNNPKDLKVNGDEKLVGEIPKKIEYPIVDFNGATLTILKDGVQYVYHRRPQIDYDKGEKNQIDIEEAQPLDESEIDADINYEDVGGGDD